MLEFIGEYGLFLAKTLTLVVAILLLVAGLASIGGKSRKIHPSGQLEVRSLNEFYQDLNKTLKNQVLDKELLKLDLKKEKKAEKEKHKQLKKDLKQTDQESPADVEKKRLFVLSFDGDVKASEVDLLREEISALLTLARADKDEVVLRLESAGGMVHSYGLAASELRRIRDKSIPLTVCIDKVAASGGYMMACVGDKILAAPFAIVGSIGVVAQMPNFSRLLKKNDIEYELHTAGEHKRTLTMFGENTDKAREKFTQDLEDTHQLFKQFVQQNRTQLNVDEVANGDIWYGNQAVDNDLVDQVMTSDQYLMEACDEADVYELTYSFKRNWQDRMSEVIEQSLDKSLTKWFTQLQKSRFFS